MKKFKEFLKERMSKVFKDQKGFSLVELIIVIAILGIIAAVALPNVIGAVDDSRKSTDIANAKNIASAVAMVRAKDATITMPDTATSIPTDKGTWGEQVIAYLSGKAPTPKFSKYDEFKVAVGATGIITITAVDTESSGGLTPAIVYPEPAEADKASNPYYKK